MRRKSSISIGPGASSLILIFVMLSLSVLAMLALTGGYNDREMGRRGADVTGQIYSLYEEAENTRAAIAEPAAGLRKTAAGEEAYRQEMAGFLSSLDAKAAAFTPDTKTSEPDAVPGANGSETSGPEAAPEAETVEDTGGEAGESEQAVTGVSAVTMDAESIRWEQKDGVYTLECAVKLDAYGSEPEEPAAWVCHKLLADRTQTEDDWEEWN